MFLYAGSLFLTAHSSLTAKLSTWLRAIHSDSIQIVFNNNPIEMTGKKHLMTLMTFSIEHHTNSKTEGITTASHKDNI